MPDVSQHIVSLVVTLIATVSVMAVTVQSLSRQIRTLSRDLCEVREKLARVVADFERCQDDLYSLQSKSWWRRLFLPKRQPKKLDTCLKIDIVDKNEHGVI